MKSSSQRRPARDQVLARRTSQPVATERSANLLLLLLLVTDAAFIGLHFLLHATAMDNPLYSLERDRGFAEFFQYTKEVWAIALVLVLGRRTRAWGWGAWAAIFLYLLVDDAFRVHEELGASVGPGLGGLTVAGLRARDWGELAVSAGAGVLLLGPLVAAYYRGAPAFKQATRHLLLFLAMIAFFGVVVDMLHAAASAHRWLRFALGVVEDGGEMIAMSGIVWYVFLLNLRNGEPGIAVRDLGRRVLQWRPSTNAGAGETGPRRKGILPKASGCVSRWVFGDEFTSVRRK